MGALLIGPVVVEVSGATAFGTLDSGGRGFRVGDVLFVYVCGGDVREQSQAAAVSLAAAAEEVARIAVRGVPLGPGGFHAARPYVLSGPRVSMGSIGVHGYGEVFTADADDLGRPRLLVGDEVVVVLTDQAAVTSLQAVAEEVRRAADAGAETARLVELGRRYEQQLLNAAAPGVVSRGSGVPGPVSDRPVT